MAAPKNQDEYKLKLTGSGITIDRPVNEATARRIVALVMGGGGGGAVGEGASLEGEASSSSLGAIGEITPKAFMSSKRPTTDIERVACLAYYLTRQRATPQFKTRELTHLNIEAAQPKLSNASFAARNAVQQEYLSLAGGGKKQITARGESVVSALPDRDKVKKALEAHPLRRRRKAKRASRTK